MGSSTALLLHSLCGHSSATADQLPSLSPLTPLVDSSAFPLSMPLLQGAKSVSGMGQRRWTVRQPPPSHEPLPAALLVAALSGYCKISGACPPLGHPRCCCCCQCFHGPHVHPHIGLLARLAAGSADDGGSSSGDEESSDDDNSDASSSSSEEEEDEEEAAAAEGAAAPPPRAAAAAPPAEDPAASEDVGSSDSEDRSEDDEEEEEDDEEEEEGEEQEGQAVDEAAAGTAEGGEEEEEVEEEDGSSEEESDEESSSDNDGSVEIVDEEGLSVGQLQSAIGQEGSSRSGAGPASKKARRG